MRTKFVAGLLLLLAIPALADQIVLKNGDKLQFLLPHVNPYSDDQITFVTGKWKASLWPWREELHNKKKAATKAAKKKAKK